jgi:NitT/TauT family transport system substrate-binding protein
VVAIAALALGACRGASAPERVTLGQVDLLGCALLFIAHDRGYFREEGLEVASRTYSTGREALAAMLGGQLDLAVAYSTPVVVRAADSPSLRVLTTLHWSVEDTRVLARRDRGIASGADLAGKRVGVPLGTSAEVFLDTLLAIHGVRAGEIARVDVAPGETGAALSRGDVDAVAVWFPQGHDLALRPAEILELRAHAYTEISMLVTRAEVLAARQPTLVRVLRALARAEALVVGSPGEALASLQRAMAGWPPERVREGWSRVHPQLGVSHVLLSSLERQAEWHRARAPGAPPRIPELRPLLAPGPLLQVDPESVTLLSAW